MELILPATEAEHTQSSCKPTYLDGNNIACYSNCYIYNHVHTNLWLDEEEILVLRLDERQIDSFWFATPIKY